MRGCLQRALARLQARQGQLVALDPQSILARGYALVLDADDRVVTNAAAVRLDQSLSVRLAKGLLDVRVQGRHPSDQPG